MPGSVCANRFCSSKSKCIAGCRELAEQLALYSEDYMFEGLKPCPPDPLLGIIERYRKDQNPNKIDLGVGVYKDEQNKTPVLATVKAAEKSLLEQQDSKAYLGPLGDQVFSARMSQLVFGESNPILDSGRFAALQTPGGCGALRVAAELIVQAKPSAKIWVSDPTWANHVPLLGDAGMEIATYPYYDYQNKCIRFDEMITTLRQAPTGDMVLLHACCHNPCGADLSPEQWDTVTQVVLEKGLIPFIDMAYQGFGDSLEQDAYGLRTITSAVPEAVIAVSCSKNFGLYRDRAGLVGFLLPNESAAVAVKSNLTKIVRGIYSMPPDHGAAVVAKILSDGSLKAQWIAELDEMRGRIQEAREAIASSMRERGFGDQFDFVKSEKGMFSFLGITPEQVQEMARQSGIYMADSSRINVAGLNRHNLGYFCDSLARACKH